MNMPKRLEKFFDRVLGYKPVCDSGEHRALQHEIEVHKKVRQLLWGEDPPPILPSKDGNQVH